MKKVMFIAILIFGVLTTNAQSDSGDFTLAPQVGINLSTYSSEAGYNFRVAPAIGVVADYYFSNRWSFRSGLQYDAMGAEDDFNNIDKLNYLTVPINASWHFGKNRNWYLNFGPAVAFLLSANSDMADGSEFDIKDFVSGLDVGFSAGIGYKFNVSEDVQMFVDYQGYNGFINIDDANSLDVDIRNARSSFNFGAVFTL